ncbi:S41 family peptidase [Caldibacillus debilis]|jgi:carboxyl-terminal processing protease|nr:S41 family peptidase [Caldibacillus debilis]MBO2480688.1 PDZ domain-containing protein [Bacillaceae bacterium]
MEDEKKGQMDDQGKTVTIKKFHFIMLLFLTVFLTAGITAFALSFGDEKVVERIQVRDREEFKKLYDVYDQIKSSYIEKVDESALIDGAINGMVEAVGDPYSDYMTKEEAESFHESISSSFEGIGAQIEERDGYIVIVAPIKGSPAEKAGLKANDKILEVDGKNIQGMSANEAVTLIRGKKGTQVELTILRPGVDEPIKVKITRDVIPIETVYSEMLDGKIGKIQITSFSERTTEELKQHLEKLKKEGMKGLILDLRQNPGGLLDQVIEIANIFIPNGKVIYQLEYKDGKVEKQTSAQKEPFEFPFVVLVDNGSASASEILAAAVQESAGMPLVGEKTFGKGTVQSSSDFQDGSTIKLTTAKWLTPNGNWIHEKGIEPDYPVKYPDYANLPYIDPNLKLKEGTESEQVKTAERFLEVLGYHPGKVDGQFDENTKAAVEAFQRDEKLKATGIVTGETTARLYENIREKLEKDDPQLKKAIEVLKEKMK